MRRPIQLRLAATGLAATGLLLAACPAAAFSPTVETWTNHREGPAGECAGFSITGTWDITHRLTTFYDADGTATRDIEQVDFVGTFSNATTGASVPDSGSRTFFDTLAPDGSFLATYMVQVRKSDYVHTAGRVDFQTGRQVGVDGFTAENLAALCEALAE